MKKIYAVSTHDPAAGPIWLVRGADPRELGVLAALTEFIGADAIEAAGAHCLIIEEPRGLHVTVQYKRDGGPVRYGTGDAEHNVYVTETDEDHARMWTGPGWYGTMYDSIDEIAYGRNYREIAFLAVHDQDLLRKRVAGREAIGALAGENGVEMPSISNVAWLQTLLEAIDASPELMERLEGDDPDSTHHMLDACRELATGGMKVLRDRHDAANPEPASDPAELSTAGYRAADALRRACVAKDPDRRSFWEAFLQEGTVSEYQLEMAGEAYVVHERAFAEDTGDIVGERIVGAFDRGGNRVPPEPFAVQLFAKMERKPA